MTFSYVERMTFVAVVVGACAAKPDAPGSYHVALKPLDYVVCAATP